MTADAILCIEKSGVFMDIFSMCNTICVARKDGRMHIYGPNVNNILEQEWKQWFKQWDGDHTSRESAQVTVWSSDPGRLPTTYLCIFFVLIQHSSMYAASSVRSRRLECHML